MSENVKDFIRNVCQLSFPLCWLHSQAESFHKVAKMTWKPMTQDSFLIFPVEIPGHSVIGLSAHISEPIIILGVLGYFDRSGWDPMSTPETKLWVEVNPSKPLRPKVRDWWFSKESD